jgi:quinol monooxygenase YgiN
MVTLIVWHKVRDYDAWKTVFDGHEDVRRSHGETEHRVYRNLREPNTVIVHNDFPSEDAARAFMADPSLPAAMERAGVDGEPWLGLSELAERKRYTDGERDAILVVHHHVRDYDTWKPVFDEHEGVRRSHGELEHRIFRSLADGNALAIHNDFPSEAQAQAFGADPSLPEAMQRAGVEGEPNIGLIQLAERKVYADAPVA